MAWVGLALSAAGFVSIVVAAVYVGRSRAKDETIDAQQSTITALVTRIESIEEQREADDRRCAEQIAELRGRVDALAEQQSEVVATMLAPRIVNGLAPYITDAIRGA